MLRAILLGVGLAVICVTQRRSTLHATGRLPLYSPIFLSFSSFFFFLLCHSRCSDRAPVVRAKALTQLAAIQAAATADDTLGIALENILGSLWQTSASLAVRSVESTEERPRAKGK